MKYLVFSDVHGAYDSIQKVINFYERNGIDRMLILGDLLYHGPRNDIPEGYAPKSVIATINPYRNVITMVKGNCDAEVDQMVLDFHIFNKKDLFINNRNVHLVHGHHLDKENNAYQKGDIVFYGHTHISKYEIINGVRYINPGSTTIPKENTKKSFIVFDEKNITLYDIEGNKLEEWES